MHVQVVIAVRKDPKTWDVDFSEGLFDRFLSPDNYIQSPGNPQNYNRYANTLNNPLKYTDPSGELPIIPVMAAVFFHTSIQNASCKLGNYAYKYNLCKF